MTRWLAAIAAFLIVGIGVTVFIGSGAATARVEIRTEQVGWPGYLEGAVRFGRLDGLTSREFTLEDQALINAIHDYDSPVVHLYGIRSMDLKPGRYQLVVWEQPCMANCDNLERPVNSADAEFEIAAGETLPIVVRFQVGATTIRVGGS